MRFYLNASDLQAWLDAWELSPTDGSKVLKIQKSKMSEYLSGARPNVPPYILAHVETFNELSKIKAQKLIKKRLQ
ncbi:hypothetical protein EAY46_15110 [Vibrio anguillarum]|uniref:Uncharacterized protein n=1 Tax=Vibrio anguillarum TaxID=55601 RepID=A0ABR9Z7H0_VIBAN|nr:hypothetical protein [Vibrio anguillarum]